MEGKHGLIIGAALIALAGIGMALIMAIGVPQQNPTAIPGAMAPVGDPNAVLPPETSTAGDPTAGNSSANQSQSGTTSGGGTTGGLYGGP